MPTTSFSADGIYHATGSSSSWVSGVARQDTYGLGKVRYTGAIRFSTLSNLDLSNISISQIEMTFYLGEHGTEGTKYLYLRKATKNDISGSAKDIRGDEIGSPQIENAYDKTVTLIFSNSSNSGMFASLRSYILGGGQTLILYTPTTRKTYSGTYTCGYDYLGVESMTIDITYTYLKSTGTIGSSYTGSASTIKINTSNSNYTHKVTWKVGSNTYSTTVGKNVKQASYTIPHSWLPSSTSATASCTLETLNGTSSLGSNTYTFTLSVPASVVPTIGQVTASLVNSGLSSTALAWGLYIQGKTKVKLTPSSVAAGTGSTITKIAITTSPYCGGYSGTSTAAWTSNVFSSSGSHSLTYTVTDARGRSASQTIEITVHAYSNPRITNAITLFRCISTGARDDIAGTYARFLAYFTCSTVDGRNSVTATFRIPPNTYTVVSGTAYTFTNAELAIDLTHEGTLTLTDTVGTTVTYKASLPSAAYLIHIRRGGKSMGLGRAGGTSDDKKIHVGWNMEFDSGKNLVINGSGSYVSVANGSYDIRLHIGSGGVNRGLYDQSSDSWIIYKNDSGDTRLPGNVGITGDVSTSGNLTVAKSISLSGTVSGGNVTSNVWGRNDDTSTESRTATRILVSQTDSDGKTYVRHRILANAAGSSSKPIYMTNGRLAEIDKVGIESGGTGNEYGRAEGFNRTYIETLSDINQIHQNGFYNVLNITLGTGAPTVGNYIVLAMGNNWIGTEGASSAYMQYGVLIAFSDRLSGRFYIAKVDTPNNAVTWDTIS